MHRYRVDFSREWITGRWGFTDRLFFELGGKVTDPSRLENAWFVQFAGSAKALGQILTRALNIQESDFERYGAIFEIKEVAAPPPDAAQASRRARRRPSYNMVGLR